MLVNRLGVNRRQLLGGNHAVKQLLQRRILDDGFSHNGNVSFSCCELNQSINPIKVAWASCGTVSTLRRSACAAMQRGLLGLL